MHLPVLYVQMHFKLHSEAVDRGLRAHVKERGLEGLNGYNEEDKAIASRTATELNTNMNLLGDLRLTMQDILRACRNVRSVNRT